MESRKPEVMFAGGIFGYNLAILFILVATVALEPAQGLRLRLGFLFSLREIAAGEEITMDYSHIIAPGHEME